MLSIIAWRMTKPARLSAQVTECGPERTTRVPQLGTIVVTGPPAMVGTTAPPENRTTRLRAGRIIVTAQIVHRTIAFTASVAMFRRRLHRRRRRPLHLMTRKRPRALVAITVTPCALSITCALAMAPSSTVANHPAATVLTTM